MNRFAARVRLLIALPTSFRFGHDGTVRHQVRGIFAEPLSARGAP